MDKFEWQASDSAPMKYPMRSLNGNLNFHDDSGSLYVPTSDRIANGWGEGMSSRINSFCEAKGSYSEVSPQNTIEFQ